MKNYKIKRYRKIYRRGPSPWRVFLTCMTVAVLAFVGWNVYGPVSEYLLGTLSAESRPTVGQTSPKTESSAPENTVPAEPTPSPTPAVPTQTRAVYLPGSILRDTAMLDSFLDSIARSEINSVLFDLKDSSGNVLYQSGLDLVAQAGAQTADAIDLAALCKKLNDRHLVPIGRLHAFRDPIAASHIPDAGVKFQNSNFLWNDNDPALGGKPWLNPYSELAQAYITDIAAEAVNLGVGQILLDSFTFPIGFGLDKASFGAKSAGMTRSDALAAFIDNVDKEVTVIGGVLSLYISGPAALGAENSYYGSSPLSLANDHVTLGVMPALFGDGYTQEGFTVTEPVTHPKETVDTLLKFLAPDLAGKKVTAVLQAYPADYTLKYNQMYSAEDINKQIAACAENKVENYIIFSPDGSYPTA